MNHINHNDLSPQTSHHCHFVPPPVHLFWGGQSPNQHIFYYHYLLLFNEIKSQPGCGLLPLTTQEWRFILGNTYWKTQWPKPDANIPLAFNPDISGSMEALSFLVMSKVPTMLQGITTLPLDCLVIATFIWTWWTTLISAKSSYTTAIPSTCLRKSRRWNASCSQLILRSDGKISVHKSRQLWRCGIHWVAASIPNSSAIRRCGENLFEQCTKL
jgi:hypothetical protein